MAESSIATIIYYADANMADMQELFKDFIKLYRNARAWKWINFYKDVGSIDPGNPVYIASESIFAICLHSSVYILSV